MQRAAMEGVVMFQPCQMGLLLVWPGWVPPSGTEHGWHGGCRRLRDATKNVASLWASPFWVSKMWVGAGLHDLRVPACCGQWSSTERACGSLTTAACSNSKQGSGTYVTASLWISILGDDFLMRNPSASGYITCHVPLGCSHVPVTTCTVPLGLRSRSEWFSSFCLALI